MPEKVLETEQSKRIGIDVPEELILVHAGRVVTHFPGFKSEKTLSAHDAKLARVMPSHEAETILVMDPNGAPNTAGNLMRDAESMSSADVELLRLFDGSSASRLSMLCHQAGLLDYGQPEVHDAGRGAAVGRGQLESRDRYRPHALRQQRGEELTGHLRLEERKVNTHCKRTDGTDRAWFELIRLQFREAIRTLSWKEVFPIS